MNVNKININQSETSYYIASDIYDVSYHNNDATFSSLSELLNAENLSTLIPIAVRCGGMTIRFIQSSDNKYVQYRLMSDTFSTTESDWQGVDDEPTADSDNLVKSGGVYEKNILSNQLVTETCANHIEKPMKFTSLLPLFSTYSNDTYTIIRIATGNYGGIVLPVKIGEVYKFSKAISNLVYTSSFPDAGVSVLSGSINVSTTTVPANANYMLITLNKSNLPIEIYSENKYTYFDGLKFFLYSGIVQNMPQYQSVYKAVLNLVIKTSIDGIYLSMLGGRNGDNDDCRFVVIDNNDNVVVSILFSKDNNIKVIENDTVYAIIDTSQIIVESGGSYFDFGKAFPINTKVKFPANAYKELNYLYNNVYSKDADNRISLTTTSLVDRNNSYKVSFIASKITGASNLSFYNLYIVDSTGENSIINTQKSYSFDEYNDIDIPSGYDELLFFNAQNSSDAFSIDIKVIEEGTTLDKINILTETWKHNFRYVYKELKIAGTHTRIVNYIYLTAGKAYYLNINKHYSDASTYNIYYEDSTGTNAMITVNKDCFFGRLYKVILPQGYDRVFVYSGDWNDISGYKVEYEVTDIDNYFSKVEENTEFSNITDGLRGKTIVCFGDSITELRNSAPGEGDKGYVEFLTEDFNCKAVRAGSGGARIAQRGMPLLEPTTKSEAYRAFDICNVIKAWCENDWTYIDPARYLLENDESPDDCSFIDGLKAVTPADVDVVTIFGGTNDFTGNSVIGTEDSTDNGTVLGAINNIVSYLMAANPKMKVYFFTPIVRYFDNVRDEAHWSDNTISSDSNMQGKKLPDLADIIAEHVKKKHIPCNNWYWTLGWNQQNFNTFFRDSDGTHPYYGFRWLANKIHAFVTSN